MSTPLDIESRLARVEATLDRIVTLLEKGPTPFAGASADAQRALSAIYGENEVKERVSELILRMGEPETLEALTRIGVLMPQLEYLMHAAAGGPELLEEGLALVRREFERQGADAADVQQRVEAAQDALVALSNPGVLRAVGRLAQSLPASGPMLEAVAQAGSEIAKVEGEHVFRERLRETLVLLIQPETLDSLARIAALAPQLEYAVHALAAGPEVLEEGLELFRKVSAKNGLSNHDLQLRAEAGLDVLRQLTDPPVLGALSEVDVRGLLELTEVISRVDNKEALLKLIDLAPALERPLSALPVQPNTLDVLTTVNQAVEDLAPSAQSVGVIGVLKAFNDPNVKRALGFALAVAERLGRHLNAPSSPQLEPGADKKTHREG